MPKRNSPAFELLPALFVTLAHLTAAGALLGFGWRAGGYPFHPTALRLYWVAVPLALVAIGWQLRRAKRAHPSGTLDLLLLSAPALASLALVGTLWLGDGLYAPYDMQDSEAVALFSLIPALAFSLIAIVYGSPAFLLVAGGAQLLVYFGTHALPSALRNAGADPLGVTPQIAVELLVIYGVGLAIAAVRRWQRPTSRPGLSLAAVVVGLLGGGLLLAIVTALPDNGAYLGYLITLPNSTAPTVVPTNAWDGLRPATLLLAGLAVLSALSLPLLSLRQAKTSQQLVAHR